MNDHAEAYREEANELLNELEASLLELEERPDDMDLVGRVFRAMHTIKGSGAMFGFDNIASFTHSIETVFDMVRNSEIPVTKNLVNLTLSACDEIKKMVDGENADKNGDIMASFKELIKPELVTAQGDPAGNLSNPLTESSSGYITYRIRFRPGRNILATGTNPATLLDELREFGECHVTARTIDIPVLEELDPEACYLFWDIILTTKRRENEIRDVFIFVEDDSEINIAVIDMENSLEDDEYKKIGEILVERNDLSSDKLSDALQGQKRIGEVLVDADIVDAGTIKSALKEQQHVREIREKRSREIQASSIRVASNKLDRLVDLVGELVTVQARLSQYSGSRDDSELLLISEEVERLTSELRDNTMSIRMLPIGTTFSKFKRLVYDLSESLGKKVKLTTDGGETELDKTVIERLNDPMVHIIRNCIDHGIESPEVRKKSGKALEGTVHLSAAHSGGNVVIKISDDGAGLDHMAIHSRAVEKGIIQPDAELTEKDIFFLIFEPGFSTAQKVTDVSGRGVGMDVVKRGVESLRGSIDIDSKRGEGTTISLKLPLTLAIIDGLLVDVGNDYYVMPISAIEECVEIDREEADRARQRNMMSFRGKAVPYLNLRDLFRIKGDLPSMEKVVITEADGEMVGLGVDLLIGQNQTVIKTLSKVYKDVEGLAGATILGDGTVALILDAAQLVKSAVHKNIM